MKKKKNIFQKTFDKIRGKSNTYYGGDFKSMEFFTDDGHIREILSEENVIVLLYLEVHPIYSQHDKYTRKRNSFLDTLADIFQQFLI